MNAKRHLPENLAPCSSVYKSLGSPYYIVAPDYTHKSAGIRVLHQLCSALNQMGYEAYVVANKTNGEYWTPRLTEEVKAAHYKANKKPIVVYPEVTKGQPLGLGVPVRYILNYPGLLGKGEKKYKDNEIIFSFHQEYYPEGVPLYLPIVNIAEIESIEARVPRVEGSSAVYYNRYKPTKAEIDALGMDCQDLSTSSKLEFKEVISILKSVEVLYCFETSAIMVEAWLSGCAVVLLPNEKMVELPLLIKNRGMNGIAWGVDVAEIKTAISTVGIAKINYINELSGWTVRLQKFIDITQRVSHEMPQQVCWPQDVIDELIMDGLSTKDIASKSDRKKYKKVNQDYKQWQIKSTLREIDADIYASYITNGCLPPIVVIVHHRKGVPLSRIADTLDSVSGNFKKADFIWIVSYESSPEGFEPSDQLFWVNEVDPEAFEIKTATPNAWVLTLDAGVILAPNALVEFAINAKNQPNVEIIYSDEDVATQDEFRVLPNFKPDLNIELLRCGNYIGGSIITRINVWLEHGCPVSIPQIYQMLLDLTLSDHGGSIYHIDSILIHGTGDIDQETENLEFQAVQKVLAGSGIVERVQPTERLGSWLVDYKKTTHKNTTLVIPTGIQPGYMRQMLESLNLYKSPNLLEAILVCNSIDLDEVQFALQDLNLAVPIKVLVTETSQYNHGAALNLGISNVQTEYVWICDDDIEFIHEDALGTLLSVANQRDVACVEPRFLSTNGSDTRLVGGPIILGMQGSAAAYKGEAHLPEEAGYFSKLQLTQDVSAVSGNSFVFKKSHWSSVHGFDEDIFTFRYTVLDFCLRLNRKGLRHIWAPLANVMHQGGKSIQKICMDFQNKILLAQREMREKDKLLEVWGLELSRDKFYNRHLSLLVPYDIESHIVIDWSQARKDRPRVLASPLKSGAGQYRVVEPLEMLQEKGLVQSSVILPMAVGTTRILQPIELIRANPDTLILQHSVDDAQLSLIDKYKIACPSVHVLQMVDDLLGFVPEKHPSRRFQSREGHRRMADALLKSDSMIVTTEPLVHHYKKYIESVKIIPNCLAPHWFNLKITKTKRDKLRVGWVGAGQHQGDLEIINDVIKETVDKVDWVFMGMHTAEAGTYIKEFHPFVSISEYPEKMASLDLDIALAPLEDNHFNSCKSNLRLLEYGAMSWPVICSDVFPYQTNNPPVIRVQHSVSDWIEALNRLISDESERLRLGKALHSWVVNNYTLSDWSSDWTQALFEGKLNTFHSK
jgi:glycosyltransferase involved in cell wall biosynthesis